MAGVTKRTLQYYDDEGLLHVKRAEDNSRIYDEEDLERLWEIMLYCKCQYKNAQKVENKNVHFPVSPPQIVSPKRLAFP